MRWTPSSRVAPNGSGRASTLDALGPTRLALRRIPALLAGENVTEIVRAVVRDLDLDADAHHLDGAADKFLGTLACRTAIHAHRRLTRSRDECPVAPDGSRPIAPTNAITAARPGRVCRCRSSISCSSRALMGVIAQATAPLRSELPVFVLTGPTGVGKSDWAIRLAGEAAVEIVSVDSALVYRGLDIGSAKPPRALRERIPHHLIDICEPTDELFRRAVCDGCHRLHRADPRAPACAAARRWNNALFTGTSARTGTPSASLSRAARAAR